MMKFPKSYDDEIPKELL